MNGLGFGVLHRQLTGYLCELEAGSIWRGEGEVVARFGFHPTENIGRPAAFIFVVPSRFPPRYSRRGGPYVGMKRNGILIHADDWLFGVVVTFGDLQNVFHLGDIFFI